MQDKRHGGFGSADEMAEALETFVASLRKTSRPILKQGKKIAKEKAKQARKLAKDEAARAQVKVAAFTQAPAGERITAFGESEPKRKGNPVKKLLLLGGLIAIGSVIVRRLLGAPSRTNWQPAYAPPPAPRPPAAPAAEADDGAGSSPDEALADAAAGPHPDTTPDEPAEVVQLEEETPEDEAAAPAEAAEPAEPAEGAGDEAEAEAAEPVELRKIETKKATKPRKPDPLTDPLPEEELVEATPLADLDTAVTDEAEAGDESGQAEEQPDEQPAEEPTAKAKPRKKA